MKQKRDRRRKKRKSMMAFLVSLNGKPVCLAGVGKNGVLGSTVQWVGGKRLDKGVLKEELRLIVGGLNTSTRQHLNWAAQDICVGDEITIKIVESTTADPPTSKYVAYGKP